MALISCTECGGTVSDKAQACPHCGAPVAARPPHSNTNGFAQPAPQGSGTGVAAKGCLGCFGVFAVLAILGSLLPGSDGASDPDDRGTMAVIQCQNYVKVRLRAPSTADFPFLDHSVSRMGNEAYVVRSYVDAQNGFGAMIRSTYACKIRYRGGDDADTGNWQLIDLQMSS